MRIGELLRRAIIANSPWALEPCDQCLALSIQNANRTRGLKGRMSPYADGIRV
jgi:hypothetical protein